MPRSADATGPGRLPAAASGPVLIGANLRLRPLDRDDAGLYVRIYTDALLMRDIGAPLSRSAAQRSFDSAYRRSHAAGPGACWWTIVGAGGDQGIGLAGLDHDGRSGELGVIVECRHQGAGVAGQALALLVDHAFDGLELDRVRIRHRAGNQAMAAIAAGLGCRRDDPVDPGDDWHWCLRASSRRSADVGPGAD